jgi:Flp pilus assembly protein TadG
MIVVFVALLMGLGVIFGTGAMVVDVGYGMGQQGAMQNGADAAALAAANLLAGSVGNATPVTYVTTDAQVNTTAVQFATYNRGGALPSATYATATEYLVWNGSACVPFSPRTFTVGSDNGLVSSFGGIHNPNPPNELGGIPLNTCAIRVYTTVTYGALFARVVPISATTESASATATARVFPATPPPGITDVWPITAYDNGLPPSAFTPGAPPTTFWTSQGNANFKETIDFSKWSQKAIDNGILNRRQLDTDYDHTWVGNNGKQIDLPHWLTNPFQGILAAGDKLEVYGGTLGANVYDAIHTTIQDTPDGTDTSSQHLGNYVTREVFLWHQGETYNKSQDLWSPWNGSGAPDRVQLSQVHCFRFYENNPNDTSKSSVSGYYVSCPNPTPSGDGPPSADANAVALVN